MRPRFRLALVAGALALAGCGEGASPARLRYTPSPTLTTDLADKPKAQERVEAVLVEMFGPSPEIMRVPPDAPLRDGGLYLASRAVIGEDEIDPAEALARARPVRVADATGQAQNIRGGYSIYKQQCLHCHGVGGDGQGPTAAFLWPPPRDYRPGVFKFTSTTGSGARSKPSRDDLRRTLRHGIANTSMPPFETLLTADEIEQVIDYVIFLSLRGETEKNLIYLAQDFEDEDADEEINAELGGEAAYEAYSGWESAEDTVIDPETPRVASTPDSVRRGLELYLGKKGLQCAGCHGLDGKGNGDAFIDYDTFKRFVFSSTPGPDQVAELGRIADEQQKKWSDDWGNPLRPANLIDRNVDYKGGRRPIDLYWRIAKGINGTPMPGHAGTITDEEIWDVVNFVLALPHQPDLLDGARMYVEPTAVTSAPAPVDSPSE